MKVVVTGGAGFIGSHTVGRLLKDGHTVVAIDNFSTGREKNILSYKNNPQFTLVKADINETVKIAPIFHDTDWVIHYAALADIVPSIEKPLSYHHSNVNGTINVLELSRAAKVKRLIYAASSSCYGIPDIYPTPETAPTHPMYPYALTKFMGEQYTLAWGQFYKLPVISLRFFNVYGPRSRTTGAYGAVFGVFLTQKLHGHPLTIVGAGLQSRDFIFVDDVVDAVILAAESNLSGEIMNVGCGNHYSINYLVSLLGGGPTVHIPERPGEPNQTFADITKIRKNLGWKPKTSFESGVAELLKYIDDWKTAPLWTPGKIQEATETWFHYLG